ncbi:MAG: DNA polymerase III subunit delta [candidate division WOR-3 bacterium]
MQKIKQSNSAISKPMPNKAPALVLQQLENEITSNKIASTYIIFTNDNVIVDEIVGLLKEALLTPGFETFDFDLLHCRDIGQAEILAKVFTPPFQAQKRLIVIKDILKIPEAERCELLTKLSKPRGFSVTVVATEWDRSLSNFVESLVEHRETEIAVYNFYKPFLSDLKEQVRRWAQVQGVVVDSDAIDLLIELAGDVPDILNKELEKIAILVGPGRRITEAMVRRLAAQSRDYELNELVTAIAEKKLNKSLKILSHLETWGEEPVKIVGWLGNSLFQLLRVKELKCYPTTVAKELNLRPTSLLLKNLISQAKNWTRKSLNHCLVELATMDSAIKKGHPQPYFLLESFLIRNLEMEI